MNMRRKTLSTGNFSDILHYSNAASSYQGLNWNAWSDESGEELGCPKSSAQMNYSRRNTISPWYPHNED